MLLSLPSSVEVPSPISNGERRGRQDRLVEGFGSDHLIILSNPPLQTRSNDVHHPYRSHSDLLYFVGWRQPGAVFVMSHESGSWVRHLFVPARDVEREIWDGRRPGLEGALEAFPIDVAHDIEDLESVLSAFLSNSRVAVTRLGVLPKVDRIVESALKAQSRDKQRYGQGPESVIDPTVRIGELRLIKSPAEIALMRHAAEITSLAHIEAMRHGGPTTANASSKQSSRGPSSPWGAISGRTRASLVPESMRRSCTTSRMMPSVVQVMSYSSMQERSTAVMPPTSPEVGQSMADSLRHNGRSTSSY